MQYFRPEEPDRFVGDAMPFWHEGRFHLFWLLDREHHGWLGGLGGHQWAHSSTADLIHWEHHPLAVALGEPGEVDSGSICTGSVFEHGGVFYAFYAGRVRNADGSVTQHLCLATSRDCIHFTKRPDNPILNPPPGYSPRHFRDPSVFRDNGGLFHMLITSELTDGLVHGRRGALAHFVSRDLKEWQTQEPFLVPGLNEAPECPDYFRWGEWYYLTFLVGGRARYRMSREPFGPWLRPPVDTFDGSCASAIKTAAFGASRRLAVGFALWRKDGSDSGSLQWGGNAVFRELVQAPDGTLWSRFPEEMVPATGEPVPLAFEAMAGEVRAYGGGDVGLCDAEGLAGAMAQGVPADARITCRVEPQAAAFGLGVRGSGRFEQVYEIRFSTHERLAWVRNRQRPWTGDPFNEALTAVDGLDQPFTLDVVLCGDLIDVCIGGRRCLLSRFPELSGDRLFLFCENGRVRFRDLVVRPLA